jgi:hypothetical protein
MQATIVIPYPGTPLFKECVEKDWLQYDPKDYVKFDMRSPVMKIPFSNERLLELTQLLYSSFFSPKYIIRKLLAVKKPADLKFLFISGKKLLGHLLDFDKEGSKYRWISPMFWFRASKSLFYNMMPKSPIR